MAATVFTITNSQTGSNGIVNFSTSMEAAVSANLTIHFLGSG